MDKARFVIALQSKINILNRKISEKNKNKYFKDMASLQVNMEAINKLQIQMETHMEILAIVAKGTFDE